MIGADRHEALVVELAERMQRQWFGKYRGTVDSVDADEKLGRIVAIVPEVYGTTVKSPPAFPCVAFAGKDHGLVMLPKKGDGVWIEFEGGDVSKPIWTGFWWGKNEMPSPAAAEVRVLVTSAGLKIVLDDDAKKLQLLHPDGAKLSLTSETITLEIGSAKLALSSSGLDVNNGAFKVST